MNQHINWTGLEQNNFRITDLNSKTRHYQTLDVSVQHAGIVARHLNLHH